MNVFDALEEAVARALYESLSVLPGEPDDGHRAAAERILNAVLAVVLEGGGTLTETECETCGGRKWVHLPYTAPKAADTCPSCSGSGRQWQIGKAEHRRMAEGDGIVFRMWDVYRFVPCSEGEDA